MQRRQFIRGIGALALAACPTCGALANKAVNSSWSYEGPLGPEYWAGLDPDYGICGSGVQQSPIDLAGSIHAQLAPLELDYGKAPSDVQDNGHTIQVSVPPGHFLQLDGDAYQLLQFHFHAPSEHQIDGRAFPMEAHFVHQGENGLAVIGVMLAEGEASNAYGPIFDAMAADQGSSEIELRALLPNDLGYYRYPGSLTTPACAEIVTWLVLHQPVQVGSSQVSRFTSLYPNNARPLQELNRRFVLRSF